MSFQVQPTRRSAQISWDERRQKQVAGPGIKQFQDKQTTNGFVRADSDPNIFSEKLTYKVHCKYSFISYVVVI